MFEGYSDAYDESARLCILRCLNEQVDLRLTDSMIADLLVQRYAINKGRGYVRNQLGWLEREVGAIRIHQAGPVSIVELLEPGQDHVLRRGFLEGVKRPAAQRG